LHNHPKPYAFTNLPLQSSLASGGSGGGAGSTKNNPVVINDCPPHDWEVKRIDHYNRIEVSNKSCENPTSTIYNPVRNTVNKFRPGHKLNQG